MINPLLMLDATAQADLVRRKEVTPLELVDAAITRIEHLNPTLNAVITPLFDLARTQATSPQLPAGPFQGVPLLLKDFLCEVTMPYNFTGQPAISLPLHWSAEGLPVGVQLVAAYDREDQLLQIAAQLEALQPWVDRYAFQ